MLHAARRPLLFLCITTFIAACSGNPGPDRPTITRPDPAPVTVSAEFDTALTRTATVSTGGGTLSVTAADGTSYVLSVPEGALLATAGLSMTPLTSLSGAPVDGRAHAVLLEPAGLQLYRAATLTITPADGQTAGATGFAAGADGSEFHLLPPLPGGATTSVSVAVPHFSQHGAFTGTDQAPAALTRPAESFAPTDWLAQQQHLTAASDRGEPGAPDLEAILNTYWLEEVRPSLSGLAASCALAEPGIPRVLEWMRAVSLYGSDDAWQAEISQAEDAVRAGAHICWEDAVLPCIDPAGPRYERVLQMARLNLLLGGSGSAYEPARPDLQCDGSCEWVWDTGHLAITADFRWRAERTGDSGNTGNVNRSWHISSTVARSARYDSRVQFEARSSQGYDITRSFMVEDVYTTPDGYVNTTSGSGTARAAQISVIFDTADCTYSASFWLESDVVHTDDDGSHAGNLLVASVRLPGQPANKSAMAGNLQLPNTVSATIAHFVFGGDSASGVVAKNPGTADFTWSMLPGTAP